MASNLEKAFVKMLYGNKTTFMVHKSGALRRTEMEKFAGSEIGKLRYKEVDISRRVNEVERTTAKNMSILLVPP